MAGLRGYFLGAIGLLGACAMPDGEVRGEPTEMIYDLPYAQGQGFSTLDQYLAHLRRLGASDRPYYEEVAPGQYRHVTGRRRSGTPEDEHIFTREELLRQFGFHD